MCPSAPDACPDEGRREFLKQVGAAAVVAGAVAHTAVAAEAPAEQPGKMPMIQLGPHTVSRLIVGANCFNAGSHLSTFVNREMKAYFTPEQILKTLRRCQEVGINAWQSGCGNLALYRRFLEEGGKMHFLAIECDNPAVIDTLKAGGCIGIAHHGERTDSLFKNKRLDHAHDYLKRIRDAGLQVGVSTHMPDVVDYVESKGWDVDYYMTCVYERHRSAEALKQLLGYTPIPIGEVYLREDPPRMYKAMQATKRPCLAFKILAAGRLSEHPAMVDMAFRETFASIKPTDGVIVGIYDRYSDQPAECAELVRRYGTPKA
ncbi:MAG TPA: hypothetical protein PLE19_13420 [Planctomycetota bacterium]|nr:hypothetical protein [Planctomycetota bacterium]HRR81372.1 hypothetical protein [Planctomycetota bacterium]HRT96435.1 hypothetical protein [Planctomycetota bacterium]